MILSESGVDEESSTPQACRARLAWYEHFKYIQVGVHGRTLQHAGVGMMSWRSLTQAAAATVLPAVAESGLNQRPTFHEPSAKGNHLQGALLVARIRVAA